MSYARYVAVFLLLVLSAGLTRADGLLYQLPKDGTWATYDFDSNTKGPGGQNMNMKGSLRIASVGQTTEQEQPCRWIEVQFDMTTTVGEHKMEQSEIYKLLIPEKFLAKGETPLEHVVRAWTQQGKNGPNKKFEKPNDIGASPLPLILSARWNDAKQLDKAETESKLGKVACDGVEGTLEFKGSRFGVVKGKFENRLSADSPFGVVTSRWTLQSPATAPVKTGDMEWKIKARRLRRRCQEQDARRKVGP